MATTFKFEELDAATHEYLVAVRDSEGVGSPGVFVRTTDALPGCGCVMGPIIIIATLLLTLTTWLGVIYNEPMRVAFLQTAGLLLGGWLLVAGFRGGKGNNKVAGTWVYVDPLYLYQAYREQISVTPVEDVVEARVTHNFNNDAYQNSVINVVLAGDEVVTVTVNNENRAEQMRVYLNYLAWARGPEGGERAKLAPATLGGLAKFVAKNGDEPLDGENNINLNRIELDITEVPEEPIREGRATPSVLPYILLLIFGTGSYFLMAYVVNPPLRDDAIFDAVMKESSLVEPRYLRAYLMDPRNTKHRDTVLKRLSGFYDKPIDHVRRNGQNAELREGMAKVLDSLRQAEQPLVSMRVTEAGTPAGKEGTKAARQTAVRDQLVNGIYDEFKKHEWGQPVKPPANIVLKEQPPPVGEQLIAFVEPPEGADKVHFDIKYTLHPANKGEYRISAFVEVRTNIEEEPVATGLVAVPGTFNAAELDAQMKRVADELVKAVVGGTGAPPGVQPKQPGVFVP